MWVTKEKIELYLDNPKTVCSLLMTLKIILLDILFSSISQTTYYGKGKLEIQWWFEILDNEILDICFFR